MINLRSVEHPNWKILTTYMLFSTPSVSFEFPIRTSNPSIPSAQILQSSLLVTRTPATEYSLPKSTIHQGLNSFLVELHEPRNQFEFVFPSTANEDGEDLSKWLEDCQVDFPNATFTSEANIQKEIKITQWLHLKFTAP